MVFSTPSASLSELCPLLLHVYLYFVHFWLTAPPPLLGYVSSSTESTQSIESKDEKYWKYRSSPWWTLRESFVFVLIWLNLPTLVTFWLPPTPTSSRLPPAVLVPFWQTTLPQRVTSFMDIPSIWHTEHSTQTYNIRSFIYSSPAKMINDSKWRS